jgi:hypothetical protein
MNENDLIENKKPETILKIKTKFKEPYIICLNDGRLSICSWKEDAQIFKKRTYEVDITLKGVFSNYQVQLQNDYILFYCYDHIKIVILYDNNEYDIQKVVSTIKGYNFEYIVPLKNDQFMTSFKYYPKIKIWDIDEDFDRYLCKLTLDLKFNLYSHIIYIDENDEFGAVCGEYGVDFATFRFFKIEDDKIKETSVCNLLVEQSGFYSYLYKVGKFIKVISWQYCDAKIFFIDFNEHTLTYTYEFSHSKLSLDIAKKVNEINLSDKVFLYSVNLSNNFVQYKFENNSIKIIVENTVDITRNSYNILKLDNGLVLIYCKCGCLFFLRFFNITDD